MKQSHVIFVAIASVLTILFSPLTILAEELVGYFSGEFDVRQGQSNYIVPIKGPKGVAGMEPSLTLVYNSGGGNGIMGRGWSLDGLSSITRCSQNVAQDGQKRGVKYDEEDQFCMDGQRLIVVKGTYGVAGSEYRTEIDSHSRIIAVGQQGNGPAHWKVQTKAGLVFYYGETQDSKLAGSMRYPETRVLMGGPAYFDRQRQLLSINTWNLSRTEDLNGNAVNYSYHNQDRDFYISKITYANKTIEFITEPRDDVFKQYFQGGLLFKQTRRIKTIQTKNGDHVLKKYHIDYREALLGKKSLVTQIRKCDRDDNCFKPLQFVWEETEGGWEHKPEYTPPYHLVAEGGGDLGARFVDVNGDGLVDLLYNLWTKNGDIKGAYLNTGSGWDHSESHAPPAHTFFYGRGNSGGRFIDVNGDGLVDMVYHNSTIQFRKVRKRIPSFGWRRMSWKWRTIEEPFSAIRKGAYLNTGSGWEYNENYTPPFNIVADENHSGNVVSKDMGVRFLDVNGDGMVDMV